MNHATTLAGHDFVVTDIMYVLDRHPDPQWRLRSNFCNPHYVIAYCKSGQAEYHYNNEQVNVSKGDVLLFPKLYQHGAASDPHDPWSFLTVAFELADLQGTAEKAIESLRAVWPLHMDMKCMSCLASCIGHGLVKSRVTYFFAEVCSWRCFISLSDNLVSL